MCMYCCFVWGTAIPHQPWNNTLDGGCACTDALFGECQYHINLKTTHGMVDVHLLLFCFVLFGERRYHINLNTWDGGCGNTTYTTKHQVWRIYRCCVCMSLGSKPGYQTCHGAACSGSGGDGDANNELKQPGEVLFLPTKGMRKVLNYCQSLWFWRCMHSLLKLYWALFCCRLWVILPQVIEERWVGGAVRECNIILPPIDAICFSFSSSSLCCWWTVSLLILSVQNMFVQLILFSAADFCLVFFVFCFVLVPTDFKRSHSRYVVCCCLWVRVYFFFFFRCI